MKIKIEDDERYQLALQNQKYEESNKVLRDRITELDRLASDNNRKQTTEITHLNNDYDRIKKILNADRERYTTDLRSLQIKIGILTRYKLSSYLLMVVLATHVNYLISVGRFSKWGTWTLVEAGVVVAMFAIWKKDMPGYIQFIIGMVLAIIGIIAQWPI